MSTPVVAPDAAPAPSPARARSALSAWRWWDVSVVALCSVLVIIALGPANIVSDSAPWRSDLSGHLVGLWQTASHWTSLLPGGWSDAMFAGYPANQLYPSLPTAIGAVASLVVPLAVALKLVVAFPLAAMPWAAYGAGRWGGLPRPYPALLAVATVPFMFDTSCVTCGGNIASTVNGEYAFAWALMFGIAGLGGLDRLLRGGPGLIPTTLLLAAGAVSHPVVGLWIALGGAILLVLRSTDLRRRATLLRVLTALGLAAAVSLSWWIPFALQRDWMTAMGFLNAADYTFWLVPASLGWQIVLFVLAAVGIVTSFRREWWLAATIAVLGVVAAMLFVTLPAGLQLYNLRLLPFWYLAVWLMAMIGVGSLVEVLASRVRKGDPVAILRLTPVAAVLVSTAVVGTTWGWWAVSTPAGDGKEGVASIAGLSVPITEQSWAARTGMAGVAEQVDAAQLSAVQGMLRQVGQRSGCGRVAWDEGDRTKPATLPFGDAHLLWQAGVWTDGCLQPITGVYSDSSATAPAAVMTQALVSAASASSTVIPSLPNYAYNLTAGVDRLRTLGVRYYVTHDETAAANAAKNSGLVKVAQTGPWTAWGVLNSDIVQALPSLPAVVEGSIPDAAWTRLTTAYFVSDSFPKVPLAQSGPASWPRVPVGTNPPTTAVQAPTLSDVSVAPDRIAFTVSTPGTPILVKVSDFPGWSATGADGPYRVSPNFMVVVPTTNAVALTKGRTGFDWLAIAFGLAGLAIVIGLVVYRVMEARGAVADDAGLEDEDIDMSDDGEHDGDDGVANVEAESEGADGQKDPREGSHEGV